MQDRRRHVWREALERRWVSLAELNEWLSETCRQSWAQTAHPEWRQLTVADVLQDEQARLLPCPRLFDGYVEQPVRISHTGLIHFQKNRYSVPTQYVNQALSLRVYPERLVLVADSAVVAEHQRSFDADETFYDWQHYIGLVAIKPGALRSGAPFKTMPDAFRALQRHLQRHTGGDRVMAQVLGAVPVHGLEAVLVSVRPHAGTVGDSYDNAMAESFFASLEAELIKRHSFEPKAHGPMAVFTWIEGWYDPRSRLSGLGYFYP